MKLSQQFAEEQAWRGWVKAAQKPDLNVAEAV